MTPTQFLNAVREAHASLVDELDDDERARFIPQSLVVASKLAVALEPLPPQVIALALLNLHIAILSDEPGVDARTLLKRWIG